MTGMMMYALATGVVVEQNSPVTSFASLTMPFLLIAGMSLTMILLMRGRPGASLGMGMLTAVIFVMEFMIFSMGTVKSADGNVSAVQSHYGISSVRGLDRGSTVADNANGAVLFAAELTGARENASGTGEPMVDGKDKTYNISFVNGEKRTVKGVLKVLKGRATLYVMNGSEQVEYRRGRNVPSRNYDYHGGTAPSSYPVAGSEGVAR